MKTAPRVLSLVLPFVFATSGLAYAKTIQEAAGKGDTARVAKLLGAGIDVDAKDQYGRTALFYAAGSGKVETVKLLLQRGADVNWKRDGLTALIGAAAVKNGSEGVKLLIDAGADVKAYGSQALKFATISGNLAGVKLLIDAGSDVNAVNDRGVTALWQAASLDLFGVTELAKLLIDAGADVNFTAGGVSVLACARARNNQAMVALLVAAGAK